MNRLKVYLFGKHSRRTPFYYPTYRRYLSAYFEYTNSYADADILVTGFVNDFIDEQKNLKAMSASNKKLRLCCISEEPLWDSLWTKWAERGHGYIYNIPVINKPEKRLSSVFLGHFNTSLFEFKYLPYFLTTNPKYLIRYIANANDILSRDKDERKALYASSRYNLRGIFEYRKGEKFTSASQGMALSNLRTELGEELLTHLSRRDSASDQDHLRIRLEGKGWLGQNQPRQVAADWHMEKMASLSAQRSQMLLSIENTCAANYITEKIFDSIFSYSMPIHALSRENEHNLRFLCGKWIGHRVDPLNNVHSECERILNASQSVSDNQQMTDFLIGHCYRAISQNPLSQIEYEVRTRSKKIYQHILSALDNVEPVSDMLR